MVQTAKNHDGSTIYYHGGRWLTKKEYDKAKSSSSSSSSSKSSSSSSSKSSSSKKKSSSSKSSSSSSTGYKPGQVVGGLAVGTVKEGVNGSGAQVWTGKGWDKVTAAQTNAMIAAAKAQSDAALRAPSSGGKSVSNSAGKPTTQPSGSKYKLTVASEEDDWNARMAAAAAAANAGTTPGAGTMGDAFNNFVNGTGSFSTVPGMNTTSTAAPNTAALQKEFNDLQTYMNAVPKGSEAWNGYNAKLTQVGGQLEAARYGGAPSIKPQTPVDMAHQGNPMAVKPTYEETIREQDKLATNPETVATNLAKTGVAGIPIGSTGATTGGAAGGGAAIDGAVVDGAAATVGAAAGAAGAAGIAGLTPTMLAILASGGIGALTSYLAANAQSDAAADATAEQKRQFDAVRQDMQPWRNAGAGALTQLTNWDAQNPAFKFETTGPNADPSYNFRFNEGMKALQNSAAARGGLLSGNTLKGITNYGQEAASQEYQNAFNRYQTTTGNKLNRLQSLAGVGQSATQQVHQAGQNYANAYGQNAQAAGSAQGSAWVGASNAVNNSLGSWLQHQQQQDNRAWMNSFLDRK